MTSLYDFSVLNQKQTKQLPLIAIGKVLCTSTPLLIGLTPQYQGLTSRTLYERYQDQGLKY